MADWTRDSDFFSDLPSSVDIRFDQQGRLTFFGQEAAGSGKSDFVEIDWSQRTAKRVTRHSVESEADEFDDFVKRNVELLLLTARKRAAGGFVECSFCAKTQNEVARIIAGPTAYICDECIRLCNEIIEEDSDRA